MAPLRWLFLIIQLVLLYHSVSGWISIETAKKAWEISSSVVSAHTWQTATGVFCCLGAYCGKKKIQRDGGVILIKPKVSIAYPPLKVLLNELRLIDRDDHEDVNDEDWEINDTKNWLEKFQPGQILIGNGESAYRIACQRLYALDLVANGCDSGEIVGVDKLSGGEHKDDMEDEKEGRMVYNSFENLATPSKAILVLRLTKWWKVYSITPVEVNVMELSSDYRNTTVLQMRTTECAGCKCLFEFSVNFDSETKNVYLKTIATGLRGGFWWRMLLRDAASTFLVSTLNTAVRRSVSDKKMLRSRQSFIDDYMTVAESAQLKKRRSKRNHILHPNEHRQKHRWQPDEWDGSGISKHHVR